MIFYCLVPPSRSRSLHSDEACNRLVEETIKEYGRVDFLVNNAGLALYFLLPLPPLPSPPCRPRSSLLFLPTRHAPNTHTDTGTTKFVAHSNLDVRSSHSIPRHKESKLWEECHMAVGQQHTAQPYHHIEGKKKTLLNKLTQHNNTTA
jgi:hypothetical protein